LAKFEGENYVLKKLKMNNIVGPIEGRNNLPCSMNDMPLEMISH